MISNCSCQLVARISIIQTLRSFGYQKHLYHTNSIYIFYLFNKNIQRNEIGKRIKRNKKQFYCLHIHNENYTLSTVEKQLYLLCSLLWIPFFFHHFKLVKNSIFTLAHFKFHKINKTVVIDHICFYSTYQLNV